MMYAKDTIDTLTECLRGELAAVETYDMAARSVKHTQAGSTLRQIRDSHDRRVSMLRERIRSGGAEPPSTGGVWGAITKAMQAGADLLGERTAVAALEEGEDRLMKMYSKGCERCDPGTQSFVNTQLLPEEQRTRDMVRTLKDFTTAAQRARP